MELSVSSETTFFNMKLQLEGSSAEDRGRIDTSPISVCRYLSTHVWVHSPLGPTHLNQLMCSMAKCHVSVQKEVISQLSNPSVVAAGLIQNFICAIISPNRDLTSHEVWLLYEIFLYSKILAMVDIHGNPWKSRNARCNQSYCKLLKYCRFL